MSSSLEKTLIDTQQKLADIEAEHQEFAYIVCHDLGASLRAIEGFAHLILEDAGDHFDEKTKKRFDHVIQGSIKSKAILDALFQYTNINTTPCNLVEVNCNQIALQVRANLSILISNKSAIIRFSELPKVIADESKLHLVFYHLLKNALTYQMHDATPLVEVSAEDKTHYWQFSVKDNGIGIDAKFADKIFKPLRRIVRDQDYPGIGIGLALAKKIIKQHNGEIWLNTSNNTATIFNFTIPK